MILSDIKRRFLIGAWVAAVVALAGITALAGVSVSAGIGALWLVACVVPPAVLLMVWHGAPPPTIAEVLYAVDRRD